MDGMEFFQGRPDKDAMMNTARRNHTTAPMARLALLFCLITAFMAPSALAAAPENDAAGAYDRLYAAFLANPADPEINFNLGLAAYAKGDYEAALMAFERVLIAEPDSARVKLEMARAFMALGSLADAKALFREVLATNPPPAVRRNINLMLADIAAAEQKDFITGAFSVGLNFDDNIEASPVSDRIKIGLFDVVLTGDTAAPRRDEIISATAVASHIHKITDTWSWKTTGLNYNSWYMGGAALDINYFGISAGPVWQGDKATADLYLYYNKVNLDYDRYMNISGLGSTSSFFVTPAFMVNAAIRVEKRRYDSLDGKNATNSQAIVSPSYAFGRNRAVLALLAERENADQGYNSYDRFQWKARLERNFPGDVLVYASYSRRESDYDEEDPLFGEKRSDTVEDLAVGCTVTLWNSADRQRRLAVDLSYVHTEADSNFDLYTYRKNVSATLVSYLF